VPPSIVEASTAQAPVAQVLATPSANPWVAETNVTEAGSKLASASAGGPDGGAAGAPVAGGTEDGAADAETGGVLDAAADVPAGAAGDETAGVDTAALVAGALPVEAVCVLLEQPAAAIRATSVMAPAFVVQEVVMRSRTQ
jgi:hypothetical protein